MDETQKPEETKYFDNPLDSANNGTCLDLRVRLASQMLIYSPTISAVVQACTRSNDDANDDKAANLAATFALNAATELLKLAGERGYLRALDDPEGMKWLEAHAGRAAEFGQMQQNAMRDATNKAVTPASRAVAAALRNPRQ